MKNYKKQIYLFLYISLVFVIGSFAILFFNFRKQVRLQNEILKIEKNLIQADSLINNLLQIESDKRGFQLTNDPDYLKNFYAIKVSSNSIIANLRKNTIAGVHTKTISQVDSLLKLRIANLDSGIVVFTTRGFDAAIGFMQLKEKRNTRHQLDQSLKALKNNLLGKLERNTSMINKSSNQNLTGLLTLSALLVLLMLVAARTFRRAQNKIIKNHNKFKEAQRIAKIGSWEWDFATDKMVWSQEQFRIFGQDRKTFELTYQDYLGHLSGKEQKNTEALIKNAIEGKVRYAVEHEITRKDGTVLMVFEQGTVLFDDDKKPIGMFGTTQDITERKKAEQELIAAQKKIQAVFDNSADGVYQSTVEGKFIMANPALAKIFGYNSVGELLSSVNNIGNEIYADHSDRERMLNQLLKQDHIENFEAAMLTRKNEIVWTNESTRVVRNDKGAILYFEGTLKDVTERKKAEVALHNSEERYRQIVETAQEGIWVLDENNYTIFVNKRMCEMLGYSREEIMGRQNYDFKDEEGRNKAMQDIERRKEGDTETQTSKFITKNGTPLWTSVSTNPIQDDEGKYVGALGMFTDITERRKADRALVVAQKKFQAIFDNTADGIYQSTVDGKFIIANPSMAIIFGYDSPDDLIQSVTNIGTQIYADPEQRNKMSEIILKQGHVEDFELQVLTKTKDIIWVSANIRMVKDETGAISYFEGTLEDITDRKKGEEQLLNMSNRLQLAIDATSIGIWDWDIANNSTVWDKEMYRIYNVDVNDPRTISEAWEATVHPDDLERVSGELQAAINGEKEYDTEFRIIWKDKTIHHVKGNALVQRNQAGEAVRMIGTNADITERKEAEEEILQLNQNLDQFANITAHDLQEPIRMVSGFLGLLEKKYTDVLDEQGKSYVFRAKDGADRMSILIKDLLEFSRSGNKAAKKESVDLLTVMDLVNKDLTIVVADTKAILNIPESLPIVTGTQSALYRLFLNLISNGIKFRKKDAVPEIALTVNELQDYWEFKLQDNGIGVAEKDQPKLFQAFQRLHRRDEYPGTGLGLVTCKKIVETHGGKIWMTSEAGKGTAFHFTINKTQLV
ncbi:MAG: PAS domain S-box protein [Bacteroidota bacterium]|nr:PAS domain S-box protein [Bacteroidota bacterium]